ncbi:PREDICTED: LON peptidase N-terminal domain and RING finger protein 3-like [Dinoponera quadriceps]|uniref:LON peptidase N-terminal domain and RING finger protein 3-like n=1 Tax=Dinoponera quadriceps TaxID=609295 RepID=A0A6P3XM37_DINQU|nr:PREDICTED: LON peptidase N-terminal domain and RING finger protein 3-like [Dinoponera quadriceps]XP_014478997.1 PREDICTED: LON peptidase N-terminal domain and RING finger protein 3-like [Dinoponera quadriceps]XP_014478998.1 PREDICTED: LON peptidase N-terminal domain and RING finger protein 3-like [Dinoponera quadriceps]
MTDNNQEDQTTTTSSFPPIDIIDLTNESPMRIRPESYICRRSLNDVFTSGYNIPTDSNHISTCKRSVSHSDKTGKTKSNNTTHMGEIVSLDDTICIPDDDKPYVTESDNGKAVPLICPICLELLCSKLKPITTPCGHLYCASCLKVHLRRSKECPKCKSTTTLKSCTRLFL